MLSAIVRFAVNYRGVVVALAMLLLAYGFYVLTRAGLDIFPEFSPKQVIIQTEAPGLATEQVEILVSRPVEAALSGLSGLTSVRSESIMGLSIVTAVFEEDAEVWRIRQLVSERLAEVAPRLPAGVQAPVPLPLASSSATVMTIGLRSDERELIDLRDLAETMVVPRLMTVPGVADVNVFGGRVRQLQLRPRLETMQAYGVGLAEIIRSAQSAIAVQGLGFITGSNQQIVLQMHQARAQETLEATLISGHESTGLRLSDVTEIDWGGAPAFGAAAIQGEPGIVMMVIGQYATNTLTTSNAVSAALSDLMPLLAREGVALDIELFQPARYIKRSVENITGHLLLGTGFVVLVLILFLFDWRSALISALAIPLSLLGAVVVLLEFGINLNIMVIGGLAIALGEVVDDAIIDTENIFRRLRENRASGVNKSLSEIVFDASMEVRGSVVYASFIVALVFVPLLTLTGISGRLFAPLGMAYIVAILASLVIALTATPALCCLLLGRGKLSDQDPPLVHWLKRGYRKVVRASCRVPVLTLTASLVLCLVGIALLPGLATRFLPELREGHYMVHTATAAGTSLEESIRMGSAMVREFLQIPGVRSASQWAGRAERGADTFGSHYSEYEIDLVPLDGAGQQAVRDALRERLEAFPGVQFEIETFLTERVNEVISGYSSPIVVNIYGEDLDRLDRRARQVASLMRTIPGAADVRVRAAPGMPTMSIEPLPEALAHYGVRAGALFEVVAAAFDGARVGQVQDERLMRDVVVILDEEDRRRPADVAALPVETAAGLVRLDQLARIHQGAGRYNIAHRGGQRMQTVTASVSGRDHGGFMNELRARVLKDIDFDAGEYAEFTGAAIEAKAAREQLLLHATLVGVGVLLLSFVAIGSLRHVLMVLLNLPFALLGGVIAAYVTGGVVSVGSMVGFITLFGITVRNAIMLLSHYRHLVTEEGMGWSVDVVVKGAEERLPSILMTALATGLAMLPLAIGSDNPGREIMGPMAAIIVGGLVSSTILNLLILPAVMHRFGRFASLAPD